MKISRHLNTLSLPNSPLVLAAGFFDGVHLGHKKIIQKAVAAARRLQGTAWILTFADHPLKLLAPSSAPCLITGAAHKQNLFQALGADGCFALPFSARVAATPPEEFIADLYHKMPALAAISVGSNWTFGHAAEGDTKVLRDLARHYGFQALITDPVCYLGEPVSSTRIRQALTTGHLADANAMLGRAFSLLGSVVVGEGIGGRLLGVPTANLSSLDEVRPQHGIYIVEVLLDRQKLQGVANVGLRPTVNPLPSAAQPTVEIHILDFDENIYGREIEVFFWERLRAELFFDSLSALKTQILKDLKQARSWFAKEAEKESK